MQCSSLYSLTVSFYSHQAPRHGELSSISMQVLNSKTIIKSCRAECCIAHTTMHPQFYRSSLCSSSLRLSSNSTACSCLFDSSKPHCFILHHSSLNFIHMQRHVPNCIILYIQIITLEVTEKRYITAFKVVTICHIYQLFA